MSAPLLEMRGIGKRFPGVVALDSVYLDVMPGEVLALVGENGAGKSTLMKILGGVHQPDDGQILVDGKPVVIESVADAIELGIGFIHQELNVLDNLDIAGNVFLGREPVWGGPLRLLDRKRMHREAEPFVRRLGLDLPTDVLVSELSIAQKQLVEIAKALSQRARLLIMDEPTSSLTQAETRRLLDVVHELKAHGVSIIYISHRLGEIEEIADRAVVLRDGRRVGEVAREEICHDLLVRLMVGRDLARMVPPPSAASDRDYFQVRDLRTTRYPDSPVSFEIGRGEIVGLAGLVGAGRSELAQAIFGVDPALGGSLTLGGKPVPIGSPTDSIAHGIYLVPEDRRHVGLIVDATIRENVSLPALGRFARLGLVDKSSERSSVSAICSKLNVKAGTVEVRAANLSGGNQQKVVLAKWLSLDPKVIVFDEPTRGIDVGAKAEIYELMRSLAAEGVAILMISSDMEEILGVSERVLVMHEGAITGSLEQTECSEEAVMRLAVGSKS